MGEEEKDILLNEDNTEAKSIEGPAAEQPEEPPTEEEKSVDEVKELAARRGRTVATGLVTAVILSLIAVIVAGIFQITSRLLIPCPTDLPINDPAPILWKNMTSQQVTAQPLGISDKISGQVKLKEASAPSAESESEVKSDDKK
ncbi:MAG: hypothetical protein ACLQPD_01875 [Desulfomonilaceae bacterium]